MDEIVTEFMTSVLMGAGQFCTNPGLVLLLKDSASDAFIDTVKEKFAGSTPGTLLSPGVAEGLASSVQLLCQYGAELLTGGGRTRAGTAVRLPTH